MSNQSDLSLFFLKILNPNGLGFKPVFILSGYGQLPETRCLWAMLELKVKGVIIRKSKKSLFLSVRNPYVCSEESKLGAVFVSNSQKSLQISLCFRHSVTDNVNNLLIITLQY